MKREGIGLVRRQGSMICPENLPRCVVVDGSLAIVRALEVILAGLGWETRVTTFTGNAFAEVLRSPTSLLITGLRPSRGCGLRLIENLRQRGWSGRVVI